MMPKEVFIWRVGCTRRLHLAVSRETSFQAVCRLGGLHSLVNSLYMCEIQTLHRVECPGGRGWHAPCNTVSAASKRV
jgi:hypothetical protein